MERLPPPCATLLASSVTTAPGSRRVTSANSHDRVPRHAHLPQRPGLNAQPRGTGPGRRAGRKASMTRQLGTAQCKTACPTQACTLRPMNRPCRARVSRAPRCKHCEGWKRRRRGGRETAPTSSRHVQITPETNRIDAPDPYLRTTQPRQISSPGTRYVRVDKRAREPPHLLAPTAVRPDQGLNRILPRLTTRWPPPPCAEHVTPALTVPGADRPGPREREYRIPGSAPSFGYGLCSLQDTGGHAGSHHRDAPIASS